MSSSGKVYAIDDIRNERARQNKLKAEGRFEHTAADVECSDLTRLAMLTEELGEVARALQNKDKDNLREELVQVGAICIAWIESLLGANMSKAWVKPPLTYLLNPAERYERSVFILNTLRPEPSSNLYLIAEKIIIDALTETI
jgi:NTP pyrophosphatase (non-canonical NTP hydrolase)